MINIWPWYVSCIGAKKRNPLTILSHPLKYSMQNRSCGQHRWKDDIDQLVNFSSITVEQVLFVGKSTAVNAKKSLKIRFKHICPKSPVPSGITINSLSHQVRKMKTQVATINKSNVNTSHGESLLWFLTCFTHICKQVTQGVGPQGTKVHMLAA